MAGDTSIKLKLSVWRDFNPSRTLIQWRSESADIQLLSANADLQQEVYSWKMTEDPFGGIPDEATRASLHELLIIQFSSSKAPDERRVSLLTPFIEKARQVIAADDSEWTVSQDAPIEDEDSPYMMNPLLALTLHLDWVRSSFSGQPGVSVSVR
jgi:hypothetical protein